MTEIIKNIGLIVASIVAIYGINAWRREFRGKKEYELAEEVLALFYDCRDRLRTIRSPFSETNEGSTREVSPDESPEERELLNRAYIAFERYKKYQGAFTKLFSLRYRFMALFGKEAAQPIEDFRKALNRVFVSAQMLPTYWRRQGRVEMTEEQLEIHLKEMHEHQSIFWGTFTERDKFNVSVEQIIARMEDICSGIIRPNSFWKKAHKFCTRRKKTKR